MEVVTSVNGVPIRLTPERWLHIVEARDELAGRFQEVLGVIEAPDWVTRGYGGLLVAWRGYGRVGCLAVVYKELGQDGGFVMTAFLTGKPKKRNKLWPSRN